MVSDIIENIKEVSKFVYNYNNKPKKILNWRTPKEIYIILHPIDNIIENIEENI